ncbi:MAG: hypothetical protein PVH68_08495 [Armatimonadota bacterium]|jgi:hypothetical protein
MTLEQAIGTAFLACVFAAAPLLFMLAYFASQFHGLSDPLALDQAQIARNIASEGDRGVFVTDVVTPLSLRHNSDLTRHPDGMNAPLGPLVLALAFRIAPPSDKAAALLTVALWYLVLGVTCLFAWRAFGPAAAALATIVVGINITVLTAALSGTPRMLTTLLCTLMLYAMYELGAGSAGGSSAPSPPMLRTCARAALWGGIFGLACLASPRACLLLPGLLLYIWAWPEARRARGVACVVAALLVASPWLVRNTLVFGNPLFSLRWYDLMMFTRSFPADSLLQTYAPPSSPLVFCITHPGEMLAKMITALGGLREALFTTSDFYVGAVFVVAAFIRLGDERFERLRLAVYVMMAVMAIGVAATRPEATAFLVFVPFVSIVASAMFLGQLSRLHLRFPIGRFRRMRADVMQWLIILAALLLLLYPVWMAFQRSKWTRPPPPPRQLLEPAEHLIEEGAPAATNMPWDVAWRLQRTGVLAPATEHEFRQIEAATGPIEYVVLGTPMRPNPRGAHDIFWLSLADPAPMDAQGYRLLAGFEIRPGLRAIVRRRGAEGG